MRPMDNWMLAALAVLAAGCASGAVPTSSDAARPADLAGRDLAGRVDDLAMLADLASVDDLDTPVADLTAPRDLASVDLLPATFPPRVAWLSSGGGSWSQTGQLNVSLGGTLSYGIVAAASDTTLSLGAFSSQIY